MAEKTLSQTSVDGISTKISTIFFDLDNTLIPTRSGDSKACRKLNEVLETEFAFNKEESSTATQSFLKAFRRCPDNSQTSLDSWRTHLWREALPKRYKQLADQIYDKWLALRYRYLSLSAEHTQLLKRFRDSGFLLGLITNGPSNAQWEKIEKLHIKQYFHCILVSSDLSWEKPNPNIFFAACKVLGVKPNRCVMVGDKLETDIKGGRIAGLGATFWLPLPTADTDLSNVSHRPDITLRQLTDICKCFPALNSTSASTSSQSWRRVQPNSGVTTSTCDNNFQQFRQTYHHHPYNLQRSNPQNWRCYESRKYSVRSAAGLDFLHSDAENSSDSLFN